ncbi:MAG: LysR family transcriptional regulator ArgP [Rhodobacteraceae bacterium]|nr:LysR family transcriptional regulator ArgP [Paracoccaceae bacterium]
MFDPAQLRALSAVLRTGSFDAAAGELGVTPSAVSQRIKALEERAGAVLVVRAAPCRPTAAGRRLARLADEMQILAEGAARDLGLADPGGPPRVAIAVNADSLATWVLPALAEVPGLLFDIVVDDQDHSADLLRAGAVSAAVTGHPGPVQGCDSLHLGALRYLATASPAFMAAHLQQGATGEGLAAAPCLTFNAKDRLQAAWLERTFGRRIAHPSHMLPSSTGFVEAALLGLGWGMNPEPLVRAHLAAGRLVELRPGAPLDVDLYWQVGRMMAGPLAPLTRAVRRAAAGVLVAARRPAEGPGRRLDALMRRRPRP